MAGDAFEGGVTGGPISSGAQPAPKGRRFIAALIDLVGVPVLLGFAFGFLLVWLNLPEWLNTIVLVTVNVAWLTVRDAYWSPGRMWFGLKLVNAVDPQQKITIGQAFLRNVLLFVPGVLFVGYPLEAIFVFGVRGDRLMDGPAKTRVISIS